MTEDEMLTTAISEFVYIEMDNVERGLYKGKRQNDSFHHRYGKREALRRAYNGKTTQINLYKR